MPPIGTVGQHRVTVTVEGQTVGGWISYQFESNIITPADAFTLTRPFDYGAWRTLRTDARVRVAIDGVPVLDGLIEKRRKGARDGTMTVAGRDRVGRMVQESAPSVNYEGLRLLDAVKLLATPWFTKVTANDARNRSVRRGKGRRVPAGNEPIEINIPVPRTGRAHPGMTRWQIIEEIVSQAGCIAWGSVDGREIFVGKPNQNQASQYLIVHAAQGSPTRGRVNGRAIDLEIEEDIGDCYSMIQVVGVGTGTESNFGDNVCNRRGIAKDGINADGTGNSFLYPKRLLMPERNYSTNDDAQRIADREMARRSFRKEVITAHMPGHGQTLSSAMTIFAPNTIARVIDEEIPGYDKEALIIGVKFMCNVTDGETTTLEMVPKGTEVVL